MSPEREESFRRLAWTMSGLVAALGPHLLRLQVWVSAFVLGVCAWRLIAEKRGWRMPVGFVRGAIAAGVTVAVVLGYSTITGLDGGTALLALMSALKLLETRTARDHTILIFIGWFLCLASFLYAQDIATAAWVLPTVWLLAAALLEVSRRGRGGPALHPFRTTGAMLLKAAPVALVLFFFFPRVEGSFWGVPSSERALTGLTEEMSPGDISDLTLNDVVAFRVRFKGDPPPRPLRYWRGLVLMSFDGYTWSRGDAQSFPPLGCRPRQRSGRLHGDARADRAAVPVRARPGGPLDARASRASPGTMAFARASPSTRCCATTRARTCATARASHSRCRCAMRACSCRRTGIRGPRSSQQNMRREAGSDEAYIRAVLDMFRQQEFFYTLTPPGLARDSVDDFLFNTRQGFCGHFASAFTTMMRAAGIPARVVAGYQGGDWNPVGGYLLVRQSHAHAWSEVWLPGQGWRRIDPTAAVAPERIERGIEASFAGSDLLPGAFMRDSPLLWKMGMIWDNVNAEWNDWVVQFDRALQNEILLDLGFDDPDWRAFATALGIGLAIAVVLLFGWLAFEFRPQSPDPAAAAYRRFTRRLARRGFERGDRRGAARFRTARAPVPSRTRAVRTRDHGDLPAPALRACAHRLRLEAVARAGRALQAVTPT